MGRGTALSLMLLAALFACIAGSAERAQDSVRITVVPPTCTEDGYSRYEDLENGSVTIGDEVPASGHRFGEWIADEEPGMARRVCEVCGIVETRPQTAALSLPIIRLSGSMAKISKENRVPLGFHFEGQDAVFECCALTTWQGHASLSYPKKNYTVRLYDDETLTHKHKLVFRQWQNEHKYVLKANYRDPSQLRNLLAADMWADFVQTRPELSPVLARTSHFGAVDGFPVAVYLNDEFHGLYTMNLHIDDDLYAMRGKHDAVMISNSADPEETRFLAHAAFTDEKNAWEVEYCGSEDAQWARDQLNELIDFVMSSDDDAFFTSLGHYLDVDAAVDYLIFIYAVGLPDNAAQDLVLLTYDGGPWIPTVYDMEHAFGLSKDGSAYLSPVDFLPGVDSSNTGSLLWDRLLRCYGGRVRARYKALRETVLREEDLIQRVEDAASVIPAEYMEMDLALYPRTSLPDPVNQIKAYIEQRLTVLDCALLGSTTTIEEGGTMP